MLLPPITTRLSEHIIGHLEEVISLRPHNELKRNTWLVRNILKNYALKDGSSLVDETQKVREEALY